MKYAWISYHREQWSISRQCQVLKVSSSGYYAWRNRQPSKCEQNNIFLDQKIQEIYKLPKGRYGSLRVWKELLIAGIKCSLNRVKRRLKALNLFAITKRKFKVTTDSKHKLPVATNLLKRNFSTTAINQKWVGDMTYIPTAQGWLYLATVIDLHSRSIIGWSMSQRINRVLVCDALMTALKYRGFPQGVIVHSDRGSQYCSKRYQKMFEVHKLTCSMSRKGSCWDTAVAESFFKTLKVEWVYQTTYQTREHARQAIFEYIETDYNRIRRHFSLDYLTPYEVEIGMKIAA